MLACYLGAMLISTFRKTRHALLILLFSAILFSCADKFPSYGIVTWSADEKVVSTGALVGISARSQLHKTLQIRLLDTNGEATADPISIPVWRVQEFGSSNEANQWMKQHQSTLHVFARSNKLALPVRDSPAIKGDNIVYRLRDQEVVKVLERQEKETDLGGLKGFWYHILADTGTDGWVFSVQLDVYEPGVTKSAAELDQDAQINQLVSGNWRPEEFAGMIENKQFDLDTFRPDRGFFVDLKQNNIHIAYDKDILDFSFKSLEKLQRNTWQASGTSLQLVFRDEKSIIVQFQKANSVLSKVFINLDDKIEDLYTGELNRRAGLLASVAGNKGIISSSNYGSITIAHDGSFTWNGWQSLQPRIIPASAQGQGIITFNIYPDGSLRDNYQGVITFNFNSSEGSKPIDFLYQIRADGVQMEFLPRSLIKENIAKKSDSSPTVLFFAY